MKTKYIVQLVIQKWVKYYTFFGFFKRGEWVDHKYEQQVVFNSYQGLQERMIQWHDANRIAERKDQKRIPLGHFRYKIYRIEEVTVERLMDQDDIDFMLGRI